jgi:hypothetical protein
MRALAQSFRHVTYLTFESVKVCDCAARQELSACCKAIHQSIHGHQSQSLAARPAGHCW